MAVERHCMQDSIPAEVSEVMGMYMYLCTFFICIM